MSYKGGHLSDGTPLNVAVYRAYRNAGLSHSQALAITAEVGRENDFNSSVLFGSHTDRASTKKGGKIRNVGMLSWNQGRDTQLLNYLKQAGVISNGVMHRTQENLNAQARFSVQEMKGAYRHKLQHFWANPNDNPESFARELGKNYIVWAYGQDTIRDKTGGRVPFDWQAHDGRRRGYLNVLGGMVGGSQVVSPMVAKPKTSSTTSQISNTTGGQYVNYYRTNRDNLGFSGHSLGQLDGVHADLGDVVALAKKMVREIDPDLTFEITEGKRSQETQNQYLSKGKTRVKVSKHQHGGAIDTIAVRNGKRHYNFDDYYLIADAMAKASEIVGVPIRWGGSWSTLSTRQSARDAVTAYKSRTKKPFLDGVHFELAGLDNVSGRYISKRMPVQPTPQHSSYQPEFITGDKLQGMLDFALGGRQPTVPQNTLKPTEASWITGDKLQGMLDFALGEKTPSHQMLQQRPPNLQTSQSSFISGEDLQKMLNSALPFG